MKKQRFSLTSSSHQRRFRLHLSKAGFYMALRMAVLIVVFLLPACASNFKGQFQKVSFRTEPDRFAKCYIHMKGDLKYISVPITMDLQRTNKPIEISCVTADGDAEGKTTADVHLNEYGGTKGFVLGLGIGWAYDRLTDAAWDYPSEIVIPLTPKAPTNKKE